MSDQQKQIDDLSSRNEEMGKTIQYLQECLKEKNRELDVNHYIWCDGGCTGGAHRYSPQTINEDFVKRAERAVRRLRRWWNNYSFKQRLKNDPVFKADYERRSAITLRRMKWKNRIRYAIGLDKKLYWPYRR